MKYYIGFLGLILVLICTPLSAQEKNLSFDQFMSWVQQYHPVVKQADLYLAFGKQEMRKARGGFDPYLYGGIDEKHYDEKEYYNKREGGILIPTVGGVELQGIVEQNRGTYLNPEQNVPNNGVYAVGAAVNIGNGLLIDKRRAALRQAEIYNLASVEERRQRLNLLYYDATVAYWEWAGSYADLQVHEEVLRLANIRFEGVKGRFDQGDLPAIDTLEAYTQVLNRSIKLQKAGYVYFSNTQELNVFLWDEEEKPIELEPLTFPQPLIKSASQELIKEDFYKSLLDHPELRLIDYDLDYLDIERRYKAEQLKPKIKLKYNFLTETFGGLEQFGFLENNYKFGIQVATPLFLRKERGDLGITRTKIVDVNYKRDLKYEQLTAKLRKVFNEYEVLSRQLAIFSQNIQGLESLLKGERIKFDLGESSLFLINARETGLFDANIINNGLYVDLIIAYSKIRTAAGLGFEDL
ncbi:TolC family protein [uncultured Cyclobacterium sp.]|uniref:TolC family protein n=1 Tax=uncultured Cyclobacterium sp. TaxID=453820 RepID=UPI0030EDF294|tara:strand:- start:44317 stop:45714 length:1398 start_codon:yes stop_codon:yes gene_type:complete